MQAFPVLLELRVPSPEDKHSTNSCANEYWILAVEQRRWRESTGHMCGHKKEPSFSEWPGKPLGGSDGQLRPEHWGGAEEEGLQAWGMVDVINLGRDGAGLWVGQTHMAGWWWAQEKRLVARSGWVYGNLGFIPQISGSQERGCLRLLP